MYNHAFQVIRSTFQDWNHGLTVGIGFGWFTQSVELTGKLLGVVAIVVGIGCSVRREIRESRVGRTRVAP